MHRDIAEEQLYFDRALAQREQHRDRLQHAPDAAANPKSAVQLMKLLDSLGLADPDESVAFGRIDVDGERRYVGKQAIWDDGNDLLVLNWQVPAVKQFYLATPEEPLGIEARRSYRAQKNQITDIDEVIFSEVAAAIEERRAPEVSDALLDALGQARSGELVDIVSTIQRSQYDVISRDIEQLLVIQGGPGTGKTVIGLHRVSWLLYNLRDRLVSNDVLVVGPNPAFIRYISSVLPSLGDTGVVQTPISSLGPKVRIGRVEPAEVRRLKGDERMVRLLRRGLANRRGIEKGPVEFKVGGRTARLAGEDLVAFVESQGPRPHNETYVNLREEIIRRVQAYLQRRGFGDLSAFDVSTRGEAIRAIDNYLERAWPNLTPQAFVLELFSTRRQLAAAAEGLLASDEIELLAIPRETRIGSWQWSDDDMAVLDAADDLLNETAATYAHVVVDEAQDLSPMQLRAIRRRSRTGSMTVLGDLAQATSPWAHASWEEVAAVLGRPGVDLDVAQLEYGYRLPMEVHQLAMRLLPYLAPELDAPQATRPSGHEPIVRSTDSPNLLTSVVEIIRQFLGTGLIGVILPTALREPLGKYLTGEGLVWASELRAASAPIVVITAEEAKGLEFDNVIVVEPAAIVEEAERGLNALFVALTRCTNRLAIVHALPLPVELCPDETTDGESGPDEPKVVTEGAPSAGPLLRTPMDGAVSDLDRQIARSVAEVLARHAVQSVRAEILPLVAEELVRLVAPAGVNDEVAGGGVRDTTS